MSDLKPLPVAEEIQTPDTVVATLTALSKTLTPLAEDVSHPRELTDMPAFHAAVAAFRRPDATITLLTQYAQGANWPLACAAFVALADRPERQSIRDAVMRKIPSTRPYALLYLFRFLASLEQRVPLGAPVLAAPDWWADNAVIPGFIDEYFEACATLGDQADFGDGLEKKADIDGDEVVKLLEKLQHPIAAQLLAQFRAWQETRIDRTFLNTVGTDRGPTDDDPLAILPATWEAPLATAEAAIRHSRPRSVLVCGDPRTGKSTFVGLLGSRLRQEGWTVFAASAAELMADQIYIGQLEGRVRKVVEALHIRRKVAWYVGDIAQLANSGQHRGQAASILDQILPAITAGNLIIIGETSQAAATRLFQAKPSLRSLMEVLALQPMSEATTLALAGEVGSRLAAQGGLEVPTPVVARVMDLAQHYLGAGQLPGAVLELLKRAALQSIAAGETVLTAESVVSTLSRISGLPAVILDTGQRADLSNIRNFFTRRVIGQGEAVRIIVDRIAMLKAGLTDPGRPIGVFLFAGPTGTGKTELAKTVAEFLFGSAERMVRLDMSEFQSLESTTKILGSRGSDDSDSLIDRIRKQPFSVILLDEFEKAHANCWDLFLQIFDDGRLTDANGRQADFRHCIIILTSNLGATAHRSAGLGFLPDADVFTDEQVLRSVSQTFRPEFVNRLDKVIVFQPLSRDLMRGILHKELARILERPGLRERTWAVEWEASVIEFLLDRGFSPQMGARPLKRAIDQHLLAPLAATLVEHRFPEGDQFLFVRSNGKEIEVEFVDPDAQPAEEQPPEIEAGDDLTLPAIILRQTGSAAERALLAASWQEISDELTGEPWRARLDELHQTLADPALWSRDDRRRVFSDLELADRIREAARTAERLFQRYDRPTRDADRTSRELAGRLALQLYNISLGIADFYDGMPVDALVRVEPPADSAEDSDACGWCTRVTNMYRQWAEKRRMQIKEISPRGGGGTPVLLITGFGAFRTLQQERGLHILEEGQGRTAARIIARVSVCGASDLGQSASGEFAAAVQVLASHPATTEIVRRYREEPAPLVRDIAAGWRSGRLAAVLDGDFDLIGAIGNGRPTPRDRRALTSG